MKDIRKDTGTLMQRITSPTLASKVNEIANTDPLTQMGEDILGFIKDRISAISKAEKLKELAYQSLQEDIASGTLTVEQKLAIIMRLSRDSNELTESLVSMFRPTGGQDSLPLSDMLRPRNDKSDIVQAFEGYSSEDLRRIDETFKVIRDIVEGGGGTVSVTGTDGNTTSVSEV